MPRPIEALVHPQALAHNLSRIRQSVPEARVMAVVKANAYGHGLERLWSGLQGADGLALLDLSEAQTLRSLGWRGPILLLEGAFEPRDLEACSRLNLWHVVHREAQIDWLAAHKTQAPHRVFLKINTGMNRLGFAPEALPSAWQRLQGLVQVDEVVLMTHLATADTDPPLEPHTLAERQLARFLEASHGLGAETSLCNSAASLRLAPQAERWRGDWLRAGIALYGSSPAHPATTADELDVQPTMSLRSELIAVQQLRAGDTVGYGATFTALAPMRLGVVACGYADGYPRSAPNGTPVLVNGVRCPLVGRVSMDMLTVDLSPALAVGAEVGAEVTLWGRCLKHPASSLSIDEVAHAAGTLSYELMCALAPRVPVRVVD